MKYIPKERSDMKSNKFIILAILFTIISITIFLYSCTPPKTEPVRPVKIADGDIDPANWGKAYPLHYELWKKTEEPTEVGKSKYKRGFDADKIIYDKLSEYPYMALLFNGFGLVWSTMNLAAMPIWS